MVAMGIDGLSSGLDSTSLINNLMQVEAIPQALLKSSVTKTNSFVSALQALNTKVASLATNATTAALPASWAAVSAASSDASVTTGLSTGAQASSLSFTVDQLAAAQTSVSGVITDLASLFGGAVPASITLGHGSGPTATVTTISLTGITTLASFANAINNSSTAGVTATFVQVSDTESRLQLTSKSTGADNTFDLYSGTVLEADHRADTAGPAVLARADAITDAQDATITLWGGTPAEQAISSASNTFSAILTGVDLTVSTLEAAPVTVNITRNDAALKKLATDMMGSLAVVFSEITSRTATTTTTDANGKSVVTGGLLSGDSSTRALQQGLYAAASYPVGGTPPADPGISPTTIGFVIGKDGTITLDNAKFAAALAADPANVQTVLTGIAERVRDFAVLASDPLDGSLSGKIKGQQDLSLTLSAQVEDWDRRLTLRREGLQKTYANLEVMLSNLKAQGDWLTSSLAALDFNTSSK